MKLISRDKARSLKMVSYFTGIPCQNNHIDKRYTNTGICYSCKREINKRNFKNNHENATRRSRKSYYKNKKARLKNSQTWANKNREKSNLIKKNYKIRHRERYLQQAREYLKRKRQDPTYRICKAIGKQLWNFLRGKKGWSSWRTFVGYTDKELIDHLKSKFTPEMSLDNYGSYWSIDHIKPVSWFLEEIKEKKLSDKEILEVVKEIWSLNNLQPLECYKNFSKNNRFIG